MIKINILKTNPDDGENTMYKNDVSILVEIFESDIIWSTKEESFNSSMGYLTKYLFWQSNYKALIERSKFSEK